MPRPIRFAALGACLAAAAGCGRDPEYGTVDGVVRVNGQPAAGLRVVLSPDPARGDGPQAQASALTGADGTFRLAGERDGRDGVVAGTYRVCVIDIPIEHPPPGWKRAERFVPAEYGNPAHTPAPPFEVRPGHQKLEIDIPGPK
ncbi:MAG: hypothetical protein C0501_17925 [Isosphaera sp.]|nr:hypothetical protein [Isosphaera sp.]